MNLFILFASAAFAFYMGHLNGLAVGYKRAIKALGDWYQRIPVAGQGPGEDAPAFMTPEEVWP